MCLVAHPYSVLGCSPNKSINWINAKRRDKMPRLNKCSVPKGPFKTEPAVYGLPPSPLHASLKKNRFFNLYYSLADCPQSIRTINFKLSVRMLLSSKSPAPVGYFRKRHSQPTLPLYNYRATTFGFK